MQWTDAAGQSYSGQSQVPYQATDTTGGAFPGGSVRWTSLGFDGGRAFDLLVTVSVEPAYYSDVVAVGYQTPLSNFATQALLTPLGFACLGFGIQPSTCVSGAAVDAATATCSDGSALTLVAA